MTAVEASLQGSAIVVFHKTMTVSLNFWIHKTFRSADLHQAVTYLQTSLSLYRRVAMQSANQKATGLSIARTCYRDLMLGFCCVTGFSSWRNPQITEHEVLVDSRCCQCVIQTRYRNRWVIVWASDEHSSSRSASRPFTNGILEN